MDYNTLLEMSTELGYRLAMSGAETFRVEESISRILGSYGLNTEVFAITNCLTVSVETPDGVLMTRMKRIGHHGNDLDAVERYNSLSRRICQQKPEPKLALQWLKETDAARLHYKLPMLLTGAAAGGAGFAVFYGGNLLDALWGGICGLLIGLISKFLDDLKVNPFFQTIAAAFFMALAAYGAGALGITTNSDTVVIGALMLLVPGMLFTNAMRDIIFGDINSGTNRIVQVLLIAAAIALGTGAGWNLAGSLWGVPVNPAPVDYSVWIECLGCLVGCAGFTIYYNIHGRGGLLCVLGGVLSWVAYSGVFHMSGNVILANFVGAIITAAYSETMARVRKSPAIAYLIVAIFPLLPGAGIYYTTNHLVRGDMDSFAAQGGQTIAIAGALAVGILLVSTIVRLQTVWRQRRK